jgi:putative membrane protein
MQPFTTEERAAIADAISRAESKTSGEIVVVVASASGRYFAIGVMWAALLALTVPLPLIWLTKWPVEHIYLVQLAVFAVGVLLIQWDPLRLALVPNGVKRARAHGRAVEQFLVQNLHTTRGRTGVLIYVSFAERFAEIIADNGIYKKAPPETWERVVRELTHHLGRGARELGLISAIEACGEILAAHFPPGRHDTDELPNHLILLDAR